MMRSTQGPVIAAATLLVAALAGCGSSGSSGSGSPGGGTSAASSQATKPAQSSGATLSVVKTALGSVVAGPDGRVVYQFDKDTKGAAKSVCSGACASVWPAVTVSGTPKAMGISGKVGTITTASGKKQVTLDGWPLYYYAGDSSAGDVNGQGIQGIWWVLDSKGAKVTTTAAASSSGGGGYGNKGGSY